MHCVLVVPGTLDAKTGGTIYDRKIVEGLIGRGWTVDVRAVGDLPSLPPRTVVLVDGLAYAATPGVVERESSRLHVVALVHLPLALEPGLSVSEAARLRALEQRVLASVSRVVVTGRVTVDWLREYGISRDRIALVEPGTDRAPSARGSGSNAVRLLCVAAVTAGKGHEMLLRALANARGGRWTLTCAGSLTRQPETVERVREVIRDRQLVDRVTLAGELAEGQLDCAYDSADAFVLATGRETYGMAVAEAIARGLPVVSTRTGAIADIVGDAGVIVDAGDEAALTRALVHVIGDAPARRRLAEAARARRGTLPTWAAAAEAMEQVLSGFAR